MAVTLTSGTTTTGGARASTDVLAGAGGLVFVVLLVVQNAIRSSEPAFAASPHDVATYFADHRVAAVLPLALYPLGMIGLLCFAAGIRNRVRGSVDRWWVDVGTFAVVIVATLFALVNVSEIAITTRADALVHEPSAVGIVWALHGGAFGLNLVAIALALVGLSRAALAQRLLPDWYGPVALAGAACLFVAAMFTVSIVDGGAWLYLGFAGFLVWGAFLVLTGLALVSRRSVASTPSGA
jgi:hypothetical protein